MWMRSAGARPDGGGAPASGAEITLWLAVAFAFIGGLILNAMPCVLADPGDEGALALASLWRRAQAAKPARKAWPIPSAQC